MDLFFLNEKGMEEKKKKTWSKRRCKERREIVCEKEEGESMETKSDGDMMWQICARKRGMKWGVVDRGGIGAFFSFSVFCKTK